MALKTGLKEAGDRRTLFVLIVASILLYGLVIILSSYAAKGGQGARCPRGATCEVSLVMLEDLNGNGAPNWGDSVTFQVNTDATTQPFVYAKCYQNGTLVYSGSAGFYDTYPWSQTFVMKSQTWTGGAADCKAELAYNDRRGTHVLSVLNFVAEA